MANPETGEVTTLIEDRMNTYIETKPLRLLNNGEEMLYWSERDGWGHWYLYDGKGNLKNQVTSGEFVTEAIDNIDEKVAGNHLHRRRSGTWRESRTSPTPIASS